MSKTCTLTSTLPLIFLLFCLQLTTSFSQDDLDVPTLLKIKNQFGNPAALSSWLPGTDHCTWPYAYCNNVRRVVALFLEGVNITSLVPPAIGDLDQLHTINIDSIPGLSGPIPSSFAKLSHLEIFNIMRTSVSGPVPGFLCHTNLTSVNFFGNKLTGQLPASLGALPHLYYLNIANNGLSGPIPPGLLHGGTATSPLFLTLYNNKLTGKIPKVYGREKFEIFNVANNRLTGDASFLFGRDQTVSDITLSGNNFKFDLTNVEMPENLLFLALSDNHIYGGVPVSLRDSRVVVLDLSYNKLCGEIPTGGQMSQFKAQAYVHNKCLCGTPLPPCEDGH